MLASSLGRRRGNPYNVVMYSFFPLFSKYLDNQSQDIKERKERANGGQSKEREGGRRKKIWARISACGSRSPGRPLASSVPSCSVMIAALEPGFAVRSFGSVHTIDTVGYLRAVNLYGHR